MTEFAALAKLDTALSLFQKLDNGIRRETITIFLMIAQHPGISPKTLEERAHSTRSAVNRHISVLTTGPDWRGQEGLGLIDNRGDDLGREFHLSTKGQALAKRVVQTLSSRVKKAAYHVQ